MERSGPDDARDDARDAGDAGRGDAGREASDPGASGAPGAPDAGEVVGDPATWFGGRGFEMFDDLDDLDDDPDAYPVAPLPPHERAWRHPSEMGEAAWVRTEPPVTIGRGLLVTSGAIGSALGVAILYLMLPTAAGTPSAGPQVTSSFAAERPAVVTLAEEATTSSLRAEPETSAVWTDQPGLTLPAADTPSTVLVMADPEQQDEPLSVAVAIEGTSYVVTTANALSSLDVATGAGVRLLGPGEPDETPWLDAELLAVQGDLAFLAPAGGAEQIEVVSFAAVASAAPGQSVTVLADEPAVVPYVSGEAVPELDADVIVEGTPVVDESGALVALCTVVIDAEGAYVDLVPIAIDDSASTEDTTGTSDPDEVETPAPGTSLEASPDPTGATTPTPGNTTNTTPTTVAATSAWIGLRFDGAPTAAPLTVTGVVAGSPALTAGVMVGERLVAIDGQAVATVDDVVTLLKKRQPGEVVKLTLVSKSAASTSTAPSNPTSPTTTPPTTAPAASNGATSTTTTTTVAASSGGSSGTTSGTTTGNTRSVSVVLGALAPTV